MFKLGINSSRIITKSTTARLLHTTRANNFDIPFLKQIPQPPGYIVGTVNDAYVGPKPDKAHGSLHWDVERAMAVGLVPLTIIPFVTGSVAPAIDAILCSTILVHSYIGFQSCIIDYIPKRVYGKQHDYAMYLLGFGTLVSAFGIYKIENDIGITGLLSKLWKKPETEAK